VDLKDMRAYFTLEASLVTDTEDVMASPSTIFEVDFQIKADHPALPGHFPAKAVVPGVILLDQVIRVLASVDVPHQSLRRLRSCKFIEPLLPNEPARIHIETLGASVSFRVTRHDVTIAKGIFDIGASASL
jgi:3-hydroxyacyl-[acyl-carrier-protein] dehydratase